jgi:hypothetical protein
MEVRHRWVGRIHPVPPIWLEVRVWLEYLQLIRSDVFAGVGVPQGDGGPVLLIPGFLAGDRSLDPMRGWLRRNGYHPLRSGINLNHESSEVLIERLVSRLRSAHGRYGRPVTLIGQSRGGVLAFVLARRHPELVNQVIALGSPLGDPLDVHPSTMAAVHMARFVHTLRRGPRNLDERFDRELLEPAAVPVTSLYSRTDGIVHSQACLRPDVVAIEVGGSHIGMSVNRRVYQEIARLLAAEGAASGRRTRARPAPAA